MKNKIVYRAPIKILVRRSVKVEFIVPDEDTDDAEIFGAIQAECQRLLEQARMHPQGLIVVNDGDGEGDL